MSESLRKALKLFEETERMLATYDIVTLDKDKQPMQVIFSEDFKEHLLKTLDESGLIGMPMAACIENESFFVLTVTTYLRKKYPGEEFSALKRMSMGKYLQLLFKQLLQERYRAEFQWAA